MPPFIAQTMDRAKSFWSRISFPQRLLVAGIAVGLVAVFFVMIAYLNRTPMGKLYSNLSPEDANRVVQTLEGEKVKYELADGGSTILVPEDKLYQLRIKIAGTGDIMGQGIGLEVFDKVTLGMTDFAQKINYQRALQGELARTISEFPAVESVRVHLVLPQRSLFIEEQKEPSVSVVLKLRNGQSLNNRDVNAMVNLFSMAVEGLSRNRIAITDTSGKALYQPEEDGSMVGLSNTQQELKHTTQQSLERRIEELLTPMVGAGRVVAKVNADINFSQKTIKKELYNPDVTVVRSESRSEESTQGQANLDAGVPDANFQGDGLTGAISNSNSSREQRQTNYEINKEEQNIVSNVGGIDRLSVAVAVDGTYVKDANTGEMVFTPRSQEELDTMTQLVANAVGFDSARGDTIKVSAVPFGAPESQQEAGLATILGEYASRLGKPLLNAALIFLFLVLVVRPVIMALIRPKVEGEMLEELAGLPIAEERLALTDSSDEELDAMAVLDKIEDIKSHALNLSEQNMDQAVGIIREWMHAASGKETLPAKTA